MERVYVHLDVDVLNAAWAPANEFAPKGGLFPEPICGLRWGGHRRFVIGAAAVGSYDPACDHENRVLGAALGFLELVARSRNADVSGSPRKECFRARFVD